MTSSKIFFSQFDTKVAQEIIEFGKRLSKTKADVYILMARKAACLISCLEEMNYLTLDGYVTSERVLDMDTAWLEGKSVIIIDDTVISGTTLYSTIERLKSVNVKSVSIHVLSVNKQHFVPELLQNENGQSYLQEPYLKLENAECIKACSDIVNALSVYPRPYDIDYPYFSQIILNEISYDKLTSFSNWMIDETTSFLQEASGIFSLTFTPTQNIKQSLNEKIGFNISDYAMIKVRTYGEKQEKKKTRYAIRILPIVVFQPLNFENIDSLFDQVAKKNNLQSFFKKQFTTYTSKLRLVQYVIASRLAEFWVETEYIDLDLSDKHDLFTLQLLFNQDVISDIFKTVTNRKRKLFDSKTELFKVSNEADQLDFESSISIEGNSVEALQTILLEPFLKLYYKKEKRAWELVEKHKTGVFKETQYHSIMNRLRTGYSITFLKNLVGKYYDFDASKIVSSFLDKAIDAGIAVPIIVEEDNIIYRAYRHGEDVIFGEKEEKLCAIVYKEFSEMAPDDLQKIVTEKLAVLLIKIGIQNKFLNPVIGNTAPKDSVISKDSHRRAIASVKTYLHGPIVIYRTFEAGQHIASKPYLNPDENSSWLTKTLISKGIIKKREGKKSIYEVDRLPQIQLDLTLEGKAENIGYIFGYLVNNQLIDTRNDFIKLSTTLYPNDIVAALSAEVNIFCYEWPNYLARLSESLNDVSTYLHRAIEIREQKNLFFTAINSGQAKFTWFMHKDALKLIEFISESLPDKMYRNIWNEFWSPNKDWSESSVDKELFKSITDQGLWLLVVNVYTRMIEYCLLSSYSLQYSVEQGSKLRDKCFSELKDYGAKLEEFSSINSNRLNVVIPLLKNFLGQFENCSKGKYLGHINEIILKIKSLLISSKPLLDNAELLINRFGRVEQITRLSHSVFININEQDNATAKMLWHKIESFIDYYKIHKLNYSGDGSDLIVKIPEDKNILDEGLWLAAGGATKSSVLINLAYELYKKFSQEVGIKCVLFTQLPENCRIKISGDTNTNFKYGYFWNQIESLPQAFFTNKFRQSELITIIENKDLLTDELTKLSEGKASSFKLLDHQILAIDELPQLIYQAKRYQYMNTNEKTYDVGIITIVSQETRAVLKYLNKTGSDEFLREGRGYYDGWLPSQNGNLHSVIVTQQTEQGQMSVVKAYDEMNRYFKPKIIFLLGIAGSIKKDVKLCDVVIGNQVIFYDSKKVTPSGDDHRADIFKPTATSKRIINKFFIEYDEPSVFNASEESFEPVFNVTQGPIGTGNAVIADSTSEIKEWLTTVNSKTAAVEMEAAGFMQAFFEDDLSKKAPSLGAIIIRGISDHADISKDDKWRKPASLNAVFALTKMLKLVSNELDENSN